MGIFDVFYARRLAGRIKKAVLGISGPEIAEGVTVQSRRSTLIVDLESRSGGRLFRLLMAGGSSESFNKKARAVGLSLELAQGEAPGSMAEILYRLEDPRP